MQVPPQMHIPIHPPPAFAIPTPIPIPFFITPPVADLPTQNPPGVEMRSTTGIRFPPQALRSGDTEDQSPRQDPPKQSSRIQQGGSQSRSQSKQDHTYQHHQNNHTDKDDYDLRHDRIRQNRPSSYQNQQPLDHHRYSSQPQTLHRTDKAQNRGADGYHPESTDLYHRQPQQHHQHQQQRQSTQRQSYHPYPRRAQESAQSQDRSPYPRHSSHQYHAQSYTDEQHQSRGYNKKPYHMHSGHHQGSFQQGRGNTGGYSARPHQFSRPGDNHHTPRTQQNRQAQAANPVTEGDLDRELDEYLGYVADPATESLDNQLDSYFGA
eukprot:TRINITY_DN4248_c0_g2_i4.p2 TRINITY_DN4248_c0_g2~~TRINITY_DN4248_c0_g2_i4.p2  ORF type:complete len:321 (-),score=68.63 TRINITY_DN4248_c0_g2_i4:207-1169(-)